MNENEIAKIIVDVAYKMHVALGPGLLESAYETVMEYDLLKRGLIVGRQVDVPIYYDGIKIETAFRADLIVNDLVIIELKSVEQLHPCSPQAVVDVFEIDGQAFGFAD